MTVAFDTVKPGDVLLDIHRYIAGNTTQRVWGEWRVRVISVDREARTAMCSWNGNPAEMYRERQFKKLRRFAPEWLRYSFARERACAACRAFESAGHRPDCNHPKAIRARKAAVSP